MDVGDVTSPDYKSHPPPNGFPQPADDAVVLKELLSRLVLGSGKHVVLVGRSVGAFTATVVATPGLPGEDSQGKGSVGGFIGIFYECGFLVPVGESVRGFFQPKDGSEAVIPPYCQFYKHGFNGLASTKDGGRYFFNGLDDATAKHYEATLTVSPVQTTVLNNYAYTALPCAYLVTDDGRALPPAYQDMTVAMPSQRPGVDMTVFRCSAEHSTYLTRTEGLVGKVMESGGRVPGVMLSRLARRYDVGVEGW